MSSFSEWLGKPNGKEMIIKIAQDNSTKEQVRCAITTYCCLFDIEVDTMEWDELMRWFHECYDSWFNSLDDLDMYMCEYLV